MMKQRVVIILIILVLLVIGVGITYSMFTSSGKVSTSDQNIAKFIFEARETNNIELPLIDLKPGDVNDYLFSVGNNNDGNVSEVTVQYEIIIKTYHFIPLVISLYNINSADELIFECNEEEFSRVNNELVCKSPPQEMEYSYAVTDNYKLKVEFPSVYNDVKYSELVDYIVLEIKSWQK